MSVDVSVSGLNPEYNVTMLGQGNISPALDETVQVDVDLSRRAIVDVVSSIDTSVDAVIGDREPIRAEVHEFINLGGSSSYNDLSDKPQIEGITLVGNKTYEELNLQRITNTELENLLTL